MICSHILVETAGAGHLAEIRKVETRCGLNPWSRETYEDLLKRSTTSFKVALDLAELPVVAGFYVASVGDDDVEILKLAVDPDYQGRGIGRKLLDEAVQEARARGCQTCFLEVRPSNRRALDFYVKNRFEIIGIRKNYYRNPPEDALLMRRSLGGGTDHSVPKC